MKGRKFDQVDTLRFVAIFMVLISHWPSLLSDFSTHTDSGELGVCLFFVISGFLITLGLLGNREQEQPAQTSLYKFYMRRFLRIFPAYYLVLLLNWIFNHEKMVIDIWWDLFYASNFHDIALKEWDFLAHYWSLAVEEQFYLVWPWFILLMPRKWILPSIISAVFLSLAVKCYWWQNHFTHWYFYVHPVAALDLLATGGLLSWLYLYQNEKLRKVFYNPFFSVFIFLQFVLCFESRNLPQLSGFFNITVRFSYGLFCAWLIGRAVFGFTGPVGYVMNNRFLQYAGKISYGLYLFHGTVPHLLSHFHLPASVSIQFLIYFVFLMALASLSWYGFENPILKLKKRFE